MDGRKRRNSLETYDLGIGFFGFFGVAFFATSLFLQASGRDAVWVSLPAVFAIVATLVILAFRQRYARRSAHGTEG